MAKNGDDLVGVTEIAAMQDVAVNTAWRWTRRDDFPAPAATLARGSVWRRRDVERWAERLPFRPGPKPKAS